MPLATAVTPCCVWQPHPAHARVRSPLVSFVSLANRRGLRMTYPDRSRVTACGRLFEGTDEISEGQTHCSGPAKGPIRHSRNRVALALNLLTGNVAERLALRKKTVSFWQCRSDIGTATDNEARTPDQSRAHRVPNHCDEPRPAAFSPVDNRAAATVLSPQAVDNYVDSSSSFSWWSLGPA